MRQEPKKNQHRQQGQARRSGPRQVEIPENPTEEEYEALVERAVYTCVWHLSNSEKTTHQLTGKLKAKAFTQEYIDAAMERLVELHLVDDEDYARRFAEEKLNAGRGMARITQDLMQRGIPRDVIETIASEVQQEEPEREFDNAYALALKRARSYPSDLDKQKRMQRLVGVLSRQGFREDVYTIARKALEEVDQERLD